MSKLRPIAAVKLAGVKVQLPAGARPVLRWIKPTTLLVDETYQRDLKRKSYKLIEKIAANFSWAHMKPPVVVEVDAGLHVVDGQHTAIAAASIGLAEIPIFIVTAPEIESRARAFVGHNADRIRVDAFAVHKAMLAARDPDALDIANVCERAGVRIRNFGKTSIIAEGDTAAIGTIRGLIKRQGVRKAREVLEALRKGQRSGIMAHEILAADKVMHVLRPGCTVEALAGIVLDGGDEALLTAIARGSRERRPVHELLAQWYARALDDRARVK